MVQLFSFFKQSLHLFRSKTEYRQQNCNIQVKLDDVSAESRCDGFLRTIYERLPVLAENMNILKVLLRLHEDHEATGKKPGNIFYMKSI